MDLDQIPLELEKKIVAPIVKDLKPAFWQIQFKIALATLLGGTLSLLYCDQFGLGYFTYSGPLHFTAHHHLDPFSCSLFCGAVFTILPTVLMKFVFCSPFQFKFICRYSQRSMFVWYLLMGNFLCYLGTGSCNQFAMSWAISAFCFGLLILNSLKRLTIFDTLPFYLNFPHKIF